MIEQDEKFIFQTKGSGGGEGTFNYNELENKPKINNVTLQGNLSSEEIGIEIPSKTSELENDSGFITDIELNPLVLRVETLETEVNTLQTDVSKNTSDITSLETNLQNYKNTVDPILTQHGNSIQVNSTDITDIKSEQVTQNTQISQNTQDIAALKGSIIYIGRIELPTSEVTQEALNARATVLGKFPPKLGYTLVDKGDGFNANVVDWVFNEEQWVNAGSSYVTIATYQQAGIVKPSTSFQGGVDVNPVTGEMTLNGGENYLNSQIPIEWDFQGKIRFNQNQQILTNPVESSDIANKQYVDENAGGIKDVEQDELVLSKFYPMSTASTVPDGTYYAFDDDGGLVYCNGRDIYKQLNNQLIFLGTTQEDVTHIAFSAKKNIYVCTGSSIYYLDRGINEILKNTSFGYPVYKIIPIDSVSQNLIITGSYCSIFTETGPGEGSVGTSFTGSSFTQSFLRRNVQFNIGYSTGVVYVSSISSYYINIASSTISEWSSVQGTNLFVGNSAYVYSFQNSNTSLIYKLLGSSRNVLRTVPNPPSTVSVRWNTNVSVDLNTPEGKKVVLVTDGSEVYVMPFPTEEVGEAILSTTLNNIKSIQKDSEGNVFFIRYNGLYKLNSDLTGTLLHEYVGNDFDNLFVSKNGTITIVRGQETFILDKDKYFRVKGSWESANSYIQGTASDIQSIQEDVEDLSNNVLQKDLDGFGKISQVNPLKQELNGITDLSFNYYKDDSGYFSSGVPVGTIAFRFTPHELNTNSESWILSYKQFIISLTNVVSISGQVDFKLYLGTNTNIIYQKRLNVGNVYYCAITFDLVSINASSGSVTVYFDNDSITAKPSFLTTDDSLIIGGRSGSNVGIGANFTIHSLRIFRNRLSKNANEYQYYYNNGLVGERSPITLVQSLSSTKPEDEFFQIAPMTLDGWGCTEPTAISIVDENIQVQQQSSPIVVWRAISNLKRGLPYGILVDMQAGSGSIFVTSFARQSQDDVTNQISLGNNSVNSTMDHRWFTGGFLREDTSYGVVIFNIPAGSTTLTIKNIHVIPIGLIADYCPYNLLPSGWNCGTGSRNLTLYQRAVLGAGANQINVQQIDTLTKAKLSLQSYIENILKSIPLLPTRSLIESRGAVYNEVTKFWELNSLTNLSQSEMDRIYSVSSQTPSNVTTGMFMRVAGLRTVFAPLSSYAGLGLDGSFMFTLCSDLEAMDMSPALMKKATEMFEGCTKLTNLTISVEYCQTDEDLYGMFALCNSLTNLKLSKLRKSLNLSSCKDLTRESNVFMFENSSPIGSISVSLHIDAYNRLLPADLEIATGKGISVTTDPV